MAPTKGRGQQAHQGKTSSTAEQTKKSTTAPATGSRHPVTPAIPLPLMSKKAGGSAAKKTFKNNSSSAPVSSLEVALVDQNGSADSKSSKLSQERSTAGEPRAPRARQEQANQSHKNGLDIGPEADLSSTTNHSAGIPNGNRGSHEAGSNESTFGPVATHVETNSRPTPSTHSTSTNLNTVAQGSSEYALPMYMPQHPPPIVSPGRAEFPAAFQPMLPSAGHPLGPHLPQDRPADRTGFDGPHQMSRHHYQMSNGGGGIMFGGFSESHTPSPAPAGGFVPPGSVNGDGQSQATHHHAHSASNGFPASINTQFRPDMASAGGPPFEGFAPGANRYGPPTPHSFHGSHTSGEPNGVDNGASIPYLSHNGPAYPVPAHHEHHTTHGHSGGPFPGFFPGQPFSRHPDMPMGDLMDSVAYFKNQFDNGELADCALELVYTTGRHHPVKITGHKLIFAQSPVLKHHIMAAGAKDAASRTITMQTDDQYLRSDAWWMALQRLYQHPLLDMPPIISNGASGINFAGDKNDRFEFCLGYAAAGHILRMPEILLRGLNVAAQLLNWNTIELALSFVLDGLVQRHTDYGIEQDGTDVSYVDMEYTHGPETKILLNAAMGFLITTFPTNFMLDSSVEDPPQFSRIPSTPDVPDSATSGLNRGASTRNSKKPARFGSIQFGDLPAAFPEEGVTPRGPAQCSRTLSRILLNLPFEEFRAVLGPEGNGTPAWTSVFELVAAREARRQRAIEAVRAGLVPNFREIQQRLSSSRRHAIIEPWDVLNWQEEVISRRVGEPARVVRKWVPQFSGASDINTQQDPHRRPVYDVPGSMV